MKGYDKAKPKCSNHGGTVSKGNEPGERIDIGIDVIDAFPFYIMLVDANHHILRANEAVRCHLGLNPEQIVGKYCPQVVHGLDHPFPGCPLEEAVKQGHFIERELFDHKSAQWLKSAIYPTRYRTREGQAVFLHMLYDITETKQAQEEIQRNYQIQTTLNAILQISLLDFPLEEQLSLVLEHLTSITWLSLQSKGGILLVEDDPEVLVMKAHRGLESVLPTCAQVAFGRCLCGRAALSGEIEFASCVDERHEIQYKNMSPHGHYCVPIISSGNLLGVINLYAKEKHRRDNKEEEFLRAVADVVAGIIERKLAESELQSSMEKLRKALGGIIQAMEIVVESKDPYTAGHQQRVANLARAIATEMKLSSELIDGIRMSAAIHDIGKISVPSEILSKPGRINEIEFSLIKMHPGIGHEILKSVEFPWPVAKIVLQHHERMNGSGYPDGLSGKDILIEARILAVADVVEAMASHRPYRVALGIDKALEEITKNKGILYDTEVVDACLRLFTEKGFKF